MFFKWCLLIGFLGCAFSAAQESRFEIPGPQNEPIVVEISSLKELTVLSYPQAWSTQLKWGVFPKGAPLKSFSAGSCRELDNQIALYEDPYLPDIAKARVFETIRDVFSVPVEMDYASALTTDTIIQKATALSGQRINLLTNPLSWKSARVTWNIHPTARILKLGKTELVQSRFNAIFESLSPGGKLSGSVSSLDLVCDLAEKKIELTLETTGEIVTQAMPVLRIAEPLAIAIWEALAPMREKLVSSVLDINRTLVTRKILEVFQSSHTPFPSEELTLFLVDKLTDERSLPRIFSRQELLRALSVEKGETQIHQANIQLTANFEEHL